MDKSTTLNFSVTNLLNTLSELAEYYRVSLNLESDLVLSAWIEKLDAFGFTDENIEDAAKRCIQELKFFPSPKEFTERLIGSKPEKLKLKSYQQWVVLLDCLTHAYSIPFRDLPLDNGARWALKLIGGIRFLADQDSRQLLFLKKEWQNLYVEYYSKPTDNNQLLLPEAKKSLETNPYEDDEYWQQIQADWYYLRQSRYDEVSDFTQSALTEQKISPEEISSSDGDYVRFLSAVNRYKLKTSSKKSEQNNQSKQESTNKTEDFVEVKAEDFVGMSFADS